MSLALCRPLVLEVALAYSTDGRDGRGGGAPLLCVASGGRSTSARSLIADDRVFACVCSLLCVCCIYRLDKRGVVYLAFFT